MALIPSFPTLPRSGLTEAEQALRDQASAGVTLGPSPETLAAIERATAANAEAARASTLGVYVTDLGTKAYEGIKALGSKFGDYLPFTKAGAKTPTFVETATAAQLAEQASGAMGSTFGGTGIYSDAVSRRYLQQTTADASASAINQAKNAQNPQDDRSHIVTLTDQDGYVLEFLVMPEIVEDRTVDYEPVAPPQFPGAFQKYKGTQSVSWSINAMLISRTTDEATLNLRHVNRLRSWTLPFFGNNTFVTDPTRLGAPPQVLKLKGLRKGMIGEVPVVVTSLNWTWPRDVDYIPAYDITETGDGGSSPANIPFPTVIQISIRVVESFSTTQFNQFDLRTYQAGDMVGAYSKPIPASSGQMTTSSTDSNYSNEGRTNPHPIVQPPQYIGNSGVLQSNVQGGRGSIIPPTVPPSISERATAAVRRGGTRAEVNRTGVYVAPGGN